MQPRRLIRDFDGGDNLDSFLVTAVVTVLLIRLALKLTGFPQLGNDKLHVAHMLWGGLGMLVAIIILLSFAGRIGNRLAAVVGGAGFGAFIDEVGKFVTQDNDYFLQPAPSIIYVVFILTYLAIRQIHYGRGRTALEYLVNAMLEAQQIAMGDLDPDERDRALTYLGQCDPNDPLVAGLNRLFRSSEVVTEGNPDFLSRAKLAATRFYKTLVTRTWFSRAVSWFFVGQLAVHVAYTVFLLVFGKSWLQVLIRRPLETLGSGDTRISFFDGAIIAFSVLATIYVAAGVYLFRRSRLRAFQLFQRSILVSLLLIQPLMFYRDQWSALIGLTFDILVFAALQFIIEREQLADHLTEA
jgi:hypothetical protein